MQIELSLPIRERLKPAADLVKNGAKEAGKVVLDAVETDLQARYLSHPMLHTTTEFSEEEMCHSLVLGFGDSMGKGWKEDGSSFAPIGNGITERLREAGINAHHLNLAIGGNVTRRIPKEFETAGLLQKLNHPYLTVYMSAGANDLGEDLLANVQVLQKLKDWFVLGNISRENADLPFDITQSMTELYSGTLKMYRNLYAQVNSTTQGHIKRLYILGIPNFSVPDHVQMDLKVIPEYQRDEIKSLDLSNPKAKQAARMTSLVGNLIILSAISRFQSAIPKSERPDILYLDSFSALSSQDDFIGEHPSDSGYRTLKNLAKKRTIFRGQVLE